MLSLLAVLVAVAAVCSASDVYDDHAAYAHHGPGFRHVPDGVAAAYRNDIRQLHVNRVADHVGAGLGTGRFVGVPGTGGYFPAYYGSYGYGYPGYYYPYAYAHGADYARHH